MKRQNGLEALVITIALLIPAGHSFSDEFYVDQNAPCESGPCDGAGWATAFQALQDALAVPPGPTLPRLIKVADGVYYPDEGGTATPDDRAASFVLQDGWSWEGGYAGSGAEPTYFCLWGWHDVE